jgi:hypothetical protein
MAKILQTPVVTPAAGCDYITIVQRKVQEIGLGQAHTLAAPTVLDLEKALGEKISRCDLWRRNWRTRIYRVQLASGELAAANPIQNLKEF